MVNKDKWYIAPSLILGTQYDIDYLESKYYFYEPQLYNGYINYAAIAINANYKGLYVTIGVLSRSSESLKDYLIQNPYYLKIGFIHYY
ncbi:MAG: hypothetical protein WC121_01390 [Candidatus Kapaibacterium sp.]